jgi:hypothetical protein
MWNWLNCYLSGRHDFGVACSSGSIYLRCNHCGKRSEGWAVHGEQKQQVIATAASQVANRQPATMKVGAPLAFAPRTVERHQQQHQHQRSA